MSLNDGTGEDLHPGWAAVVRADALWLEDGGSPVALDPAAARLTVKSARGAAIDLPWHMVADLASGLVLDESNDSVRLAWALPAAETTALTVGDYTVVVEWMGQSSRPLSFTVKPEPAALEPRDLVRKAILESDATLLLGDTGAALAALTTAEVALPDALDLLQQKARVLVARGEFAPAMQATQRALKIFRQQYPDAPEPPVGILFIQREAEAGWLRSHGAANAPGAPPAAPALLPAPASDPVPAPAAPAATDTSEAGAPDSRLAGDPRSAQAAAALVPDQPAVDGDLPDQPAATASNAPTVDRTGPGPVSWLGDAPVPFEGNGQWALSARAGSQYGEIERSASRATGPPDVPGADDHPNAWCPAVRDSGSDWLELGFETTAPATEVRVRQSYGPGAIVRVEALDTDGQAHLWWEGADPYGQEGLAPDAVWFSVQVPRTEYAVQAIRLTLDLAAHGRWKQIDAVQLIDATPP